MTVSASGSTFSALNRLVAIHSRSLPVYLTDARPWGRPGQDEVRRLLQDIANDHRETVDRLAELISESDEYVNTGDFPLVFTCYNDLSLDYLLNKCIEFQKRDLRVIDECLTSLDGSPRLTALVQEIRGAALGHLDSMVELQRASSSSAAHGTV